MEATENKIMQAEETVEKPYHFRKLGAPDMFLMCKIIKAIGINEFMACVQGDSLKQLLKTLTDKGGDAIKDDSMVMLGALAGTLEIANVIIGNLPRCENEIYQMLSQVSGMDIEEIKAPGNAVMFFEMVIDFVKKEEFKDFIKVVSKLFK